jgi:hypothetical protein
VRLTSKSRPARGHRRRCAKEGLVASEEALHSKEIIVNILDTIAFLLVIPEVLIWVRPWIEKGASAIWRMVTFVLLFLIFIFADEMWVDILPWWA